MVIKNRTWTMENREQLEFLLKEGYTIPKISVLLGISPGTIYREIKTTLSDKEYEDRQFIKYTAKKALDRDIEKLKGDE